MKEKLEIILKAIGEKKGEDILVFAFSSLNPAVDEVVIASASNQRQVFALADNVKDRLAEHGMRVDHVEGGRDSRCFYYWRTCYPLGAGAGAAA